MKCRVAPESILHLDLFEEMEIKAVSITVLASREKGNHQGRRQIRYYH